MTEWTGRETRALRHALRMTIVLFSGHLGVGKRTVSKWESRCSTSTTNRPSQYRAKRSPTYANGCEVLTPETLWLIRLPETTESTTIPPRLDREGVRWRLGSAETVSVVDPVAFGAGPCQQLARDSTVDRPR